MKATLEFNLPEDQKTFEAALTAGEYRAALGNVMDLLRQSLEEPNTSDETHKFLIALAANADALARESAIKDYP